MNIVTFHVQSGGVGDYRHWIPARALAAKGHQVWCAPDTEIAIPWDTPHKLEAFLIERSAWADIFHLGFVSNVNFLQRWVSAREYAKRTLGRSVPLLVDCDDDILNVPAYNTAFKAYSASKEAMRHASLSLRVADTVSVTTPQLKALYAHINEHIVVLPNCLDPLDWEYDSGPKHDEVRLVFAGGLGRKNDLDEIRHALEAVMRQRPNVRLFFMGMMPDWVAEQWAQSPDDPHGNRAFFINVAPPSVYRQIMQWMRFDIALAPVVKNDFNRGKSSIKVMESAMYGAASVCTDWDTYAEVPSDAVLKCDTTYEWRESLLALIDDPELRARKVARCREWVLDERSIDGKIHLWEAAYEEAMARPVIGDDGTGIKGFDANNSSRNGNGQTPRPDIASG